MHMTRADWVFFKPCYSKKSRKIITPNSNLLNTAKNWSYGTFCLRGGFGLYISSSSSCRIISTDIPDPLSSSFLIVHCFLQVFRAISRIATELLYVGSSLYIYIYIYIYTCRVNGNKPNRIFIMHWILHWGHIFFQGLYEI